MDEKWAETQFFAHFSHGKEDAYLKFCNTPESADCWLCTHKKGKRGCRLPRCPYIQERISAGTVSYREAVAEMCSALELSSRRIVFTGRHYPGTMWSESEQKRRMVLLRDFVGWIGIPRENRYLAAMYLLTATQRLYSRTRQCFTKTGVNFDLAKPRGLSIDEYTLLGAAKTIYLGTEDLTLEDLDDPEIVSEDALRLIVNALLVASYGFDALNIGM